MSLIKILAVSLNICIEVENNILKTLLYDYAKDTLTRKQLYLLYLQISSAGEKRDAEFYKLMHRWITKDPDSIIKQLIRS